MLAILAFISVDGFALSFYMYSAALKGLPWFCPSFCSSYFSSPMSSVSN
jgi:hypothetical protein